jgi:dihydrolipoamide dehydrogenase
MNRSAVPEQTEVAVLGAGPGGYTAAFRAADLGRKVVLIDAAERLGGVCLNVGCIPSKALLHTAKVLGEAQRLEGVQFGPPRIDLDAVRKGKDATVARLTDGIGLMARQRGVRVLCGHARFLTPRSLAVDTVAGVRELHFEQAIIACGSSPMRLPGLPRDPRVMDSTAALELPEVPGRLLIVGGGIIGLEMAAIYHAFGARVTVVERLPRLLAGADADLVQVLQQAIASRYEAIHVGTQMDDVGAGPAGLRVRLVSPEASTEETFDRMLVAVGRRPNGGQIDAHKAGVLVDERGFIRVDVRQRTNVPHIYAIGDVVGEPMLAHKATREAKVAAEVLCGRDASFDARTIPSVAYTDPELAWMGLTEDEAARKGIAFEKAVFPWHASGRAHASGAGKGLTKLLFDPRTHRILGAGIVGAGAGELIAETVLALECDAETGDLAAAIHPHPTFAETIAQCAEVAEGSVTDLPPARAGGRPATRR